MDGNESRLISALRDLLADYDALLWSHNFDLENRCDDAEPRAESSRVARDLIEELEDRTNG